MRFIRHLFLLLFLCSATSITLAQDAPWNDVLSKLPKYERLEGTLTVRGYQTDIGLGGGTAVANVKFEQPDSLRVEIKADSSQGTRPFVLVAQGDQTHIYDPISHRLRELPYNIAREWWRGWDILHGGPANALFVGFSPQQLSQFYDIKSQASALNLLATEKQALQQPDFIGVGGSGDKIFYAPYLHQVWNYSPQLNWKFGADGLPIQREEGFTEKVLYKTTITVDTTSQLPKTAVVTDFKGSHVATFTYDLQKTAEAFDKSTFTIAAAAAQIPEAARLNAPASYTGSDANTAYNKGVALAIGEEDYAGAYALWQQASKAQPKAVAPWFALYESSLQTHDLNRAQIALGELAKILGADNEDVLTRQASLATSFLQWESAEAALDQLVKLQPDNAQFLLAYANFQHSQGKTGAERGALGKILAMPNAPAGIQAAAILNWSLNALTRTDRTASDIDDTTAAQKLAKQIALLNANPSQVKIDSAPFTDHPSLLTALALVQEQYGQHDDAMKTWALVENAFPFPLDRTAQWHLLSIAAQKSDTSSASKYYDALRATVFTRDETRKLYDQVINTWQKAFGQDALYDSLKRRALAMQSTPMDAQLWLAFQSTFGSDEDIAEAIKNGATRFSKDPWWYSLRADSLTSYAASPDVGAPGTLSLSEALNAALQAVDEAIKRDSKQPYYHLQKALILRQIAMPNSPIIDSHKRGINRKAATAAYQDLTQKWPNNSDIELSADIMHLPLDESATEQAATLQSIQQTMHQAVPLQSTYQDSAASAGNHTRAFTARQAKAAIARRQGNLDAVAQYYQELLVSARSAEEEQGIAVNYLRQLTYAKDTKAIAALLTRLSHEPWKWKPLTEMMNAAGGVLAFNPPLANDVTRALQSSSDPYAHWAAARLSATVVASLNLVLQNPKAPENLQGEQSVAMKSLGNVLTSLIPVVDGSDKVLAARAAAALGESALERGVQSDDEEAKKAAQVATQWFQKAVAIDPSELAYDQNLVTAFVTAGDNASAKSARSAMLTKLLLDPEAMRQAAKVTLMTATDVADKALAAKIAVSAFRLAQTSTTTSTSTFWRAGITAARSLMAAGNTDDAANIYQQLSLPQWTDTDRAVTFLDWQYQLRKLGQDEAAAEVQEKLQELGLNNPQLKSAEWNWHTLD